MQELGIARDPPRFPLRSGFGEAGHVGYVSRDRSADVAKLWVDMQTLSLRDLRPCADGPCCPLAALRVLDSTVLEQPSPVATAMVRKFKHHEQVIMFTKMIVIMSLTVRLAPSSQS